MPVGPCDCIFGEPTPWVIERKGDYATVFDSAGKVVPLLTELDLGWTDTETGNYIDPQGDYDILERIVKAVNSYASNQATIRELVEALAEITTLYGRTEKSVAALAKATNEGLTFP